MKLNNICDMTKGWFVGDFKPTAYKTNNAEVAVKTYKAGDREVEHYHKAADEVTLILSGTATINGVQYSQGSIITIFKNEKAAFIADTDCTTVVFKSCSAKNDKYED